MRPALYGARLEAAGAGTVRPGREATGFTLAGLRVTLHLSDGSSAEGDLLVGADGFRSIVRRQLHPTEGPPRSSRLVSVRGAVEDALDHLGGWTRSITSARESSRRSSVPVRPASTGSSRVPKDYCLAERRIPGRCSRTWRLGSSGHSGRSPRRRQSFAATGFSWIATRCPHGEPAW